MIHAALGALLQEKGEFSEAEREYDEAISRDRTVVLAFANRGELRCLRGDRRGIDDLKYAASVESPVQLRAKALLRRFSQ